MTNAEFSNEFDVLYNSITSNQAPGLDEYEKSVFLTKAQSQLVNEYFNQKVDGVGGGFDGSQRRQYDFSSLIRVEKLYNLNTFVERISNNEKVDRRSRVFLFPQNYFFSVNEVISDSKCQYSVLPISYNEYQRLMLKPYSFPVKKGAWRLITDKKNCNFYREFVPTTNEYGEVVNSETDYKFLFSWADQKRNLNVTILSAVNTVEENQQAAIEIPTITFANGSHPKVCVGDKFIYFYTYYDGGYSWRSIVCDCGWKGSSLTYTVSVTLNSQSEAPDDQDTIELLKTGFEYAKYYLDTKGLWEKDYDVIKAIKRTDGFYMCSAPSKFSSFSAIEGKTITTQVIQIPMVEIIGRFNGDINYQIRYVKTLAPIILRDLSDGSDDLSIDGYTGPLECELPVEAHQELLERAVTLAKLAWAGSSSTMQKSQKEKD